MRAGGFNGRKISTPRGQRGVVLLITLIILVAMTLAGIGMMRSVDTGNIIAGNLAFRQATVNASDAGTAAGFNRLMSVANSSNKADINVLNFKNGDPCPAGVTASLCSGGNINLLGYAPTPILACEVTNTCPVVANAQPWWSDAANWNNAAILPPITDPNGGTIAIATVSYLINRMCTSGGAPDPSVPGQACQTFTQVTTGCGKSIPPPPCNNTFVFYRITTRSVGTRNTVTYTQTLVLI